MFRDTSFIQIFSKTFCLHFFWSASLSQYGLLKPNHSGFRNSTKTENAVDTMQSAKVVDKCSVSILLELLVGLNSVNYQDLYSHGLSNSYRVGSTECHGEARSTGCIRSQLVYHMDQTGISKCCSHDFVD